MLKIDTSIFRKYDIRGVVAGDNPQITPELARAVGQALGTYLPEKFGTEQMFVGSDNRPSSDGLRAAMIEGIAASGMNVTDIGQVLTPTLYFASATYGDKGAGVMITGSHLDTRYNGIKMAYGAEASISPVTALWLAALPIFDLFISFGRRIAKGQNPMSPDRGHFHHILQRAGFRDREIVLIMGLSGLAIAVIGCAGSLLGVHDGIMFFGFMAMGAWQAWLYSRAWRIARWLRRRRGDAARAAGAAERT